MEQIGIVKKIDNLGRVVIPKDIRERYFVSDEVEILTTDEGIVIRNCEYIVVKKQASVE